MNSPLSIIISREYLERVKRKSFIISTILVPIFMVLMMVAPAALMLMSSPESSRVAVLDHTGVIAPRLHGNSEITFVTTTTDSLSTLKADKDFDVIVVLGENAVRQPANAVSVFSRGTLPMMSDSYITSQINRAIEDCRLADRDLGGLRQIMSQIEVNESYPVVNLESSDESTTSSTASYLLALTMDMVLYMFILIYGQMVMNSIIEEKNNRVLELVVSSVKPKILMMGKILGVGLVAVTQIVIWGIILAACSAWILPLFGDAAASTGDSEVLAALGQLSNPGYVINLLLMMLLFAIGGYLFYSSIYAAIASAVDNVQDAGQLSSVATIPVIIAIVASMSVLNNPNGTLAIWLSFIPFTSPMIMMARLPFGVPAWQIAGSLVALYISFMFMIWLCAKIYRVGIFMYGKKPTLVEILKWARYK